MEQVKRPLSPEEILRRREELQSLVDNPTFRRLLTRQQELQTSSLLAAHMAASKGEFAVAAAELRYSAGLEQVKKWVEAEGQRLNQEAKEPKGY